MTRAKLFSYKHSQIYYKKYGISPDRHFDILRKRWGADAAIEIVNRNMEKLLTSGWEKADGRTPFDSPLT